MPPVPHTARCVRCAAPLSADQRYCVACGTRRGALPARVQSALAALAGNRPASPAPAVPPAPPAPGYSLLSTARAAALVILLMLGVGSVIGAASTPGGVTSLASTIVLALPHSSPAAPSTLADAGSGGGGGSSAGGGSGGGSGSTGGGGGGSAAAGTQTTRTITVSQSSGAPTGTQSATTSTTSASAPTDALPAIHHVWLIVLSGQGYAQSFGAVTGPHYLSRTLADQGTVLSQYDAVSQSPLANEVALVSGQGPTPQTLQDCPVYSSLAPGRIGRQGQARGDGCIYPSAVPTLGSELSIDGQSWRAYIQGIGETAQRHPSTSTSTSTSTAAGTTTATATGAPATTTTTSTSGTASAGTATSTTTGTSTAGGFGTGTTGTTTLPDTSTAAGCPHPAQGATDPDAAVDGRNDYVTWTNPWVYFDSLLSTRTCADQDTGIGSLARDLRSVATTPAFSYIAADPCDDGSDTPCRTGAATGMGPADDFLHSVVPEIERSPAYRAGGLILVTFAEAPQSGPNWSTASCCGEPVYPNLPASATGGTSTTATGTGTTGTGTATLGTGTAPFGAGTATAGTGTFGTGTTTGTPTTTTTTTTAGAVGTTTAGSTGTSGTATVPGTTTACGEGSGTGTDTTATTPTTSSTTTATTTTATSTAGTSSPCGPVTTGDPPGGGQVGLLMISPWVAPHTVDEIRVYNHFSLLKTVSDLLGVTPPGYADGSDIETFSPSLFLSTMR